jgi:nucleotide-binding universal stress UspA family protein
MEQHRKILLATDLSARSDRALDRASMLTRRHGAELFVVHVLEPTPEMLDAQTVRFSPLAARDRLIEIVRRDLLSDLDDAGGRVTLRIEEGNPADVILGIAKEQGCDVIVTGVARNETLGRFTLGKTVDRLLRVSEVPLLIVTDRPRKPYQKIVVGTDFSDASQHALEAAAALFPNEKLAIFHAYDAPGAYSSSDAKRRQAQLRLWAHDDYTAFLKRANLPEETRSRLSVLLEWGDPDRLLRELAQTAAADLVVLGTRRRGVVLHALLGSVAKRIVTILPCDALVVGSRITQEALSHNDATSS